jgi:pimeloyl-ACP methyl ester carboxylesterase
MPDWFHLRSEGGTGSAASDHPITFPKGIKVLHEPPNPNIDIVFVHGLTGDREKTWAARNQSPWPQTELPKRIPQARVITFGYDAYISNWRHVVSENRLGDHARDLLNEIAACRIGAEMRPIIFVAHSLGGLVVKDTLLAAWRDGRKHIEQILESTRAIAFLGTPHGGSGLAAWAERSVRFLGIFKQANPDILTLLRPNSEVLSRVHDDFLRMIRPRTDGIKQHMIMVTCFYEALPMPCIGFVVRMGSAVIAGYDRISIQANHRDMARFHSGGDPGFKSLVAELDKWVRLTSSTIGSASMFYENTTLEASKMAQANLEIACLHSTAFVEMENRRMAIEEPAAETCNWIFDHAVYNEWYSRENIEASQGLLWIKGKPGSGKSTIMKQIHKRTATEEGHSIACLAFFFSARGAEIERSPYGLYRALVHQLVWQKRSFLQDLSVLYDEKVKKVGANNFEWHLKELQKFFHDAITQPGQGTVKVFVDALDECIDEDVRKVVRAFEESAGVAMANDAELNICWSSRHYPHIKVCKSHEVLMEHQNASDIALYVHNMLSKGSTTSHSDIEEKIVRKANGVFIWVVLVVNRLFGAAEYEQSRTEKMRMLDQIPSELNGLFGVILGTVKEIHRPETLLFFQWVLLAIRPLTLDEFRYAIAFSAEPPPTSVKAWKLGDRYLESETALTSLIRDRSGGLLEVIEAEGSRVIQFIHESVRDFLSGDAGMAILKYVYYAVVKASLAVVFRLNIDSTIEPWDFSPVMLSKSRLLKPETVFLLPFAIMECTTDSRISAVSTKTTISLTVVTSG